MNSISLAAAADALSHLSPACNREFWVRMAIALYDEYGDAGWPTWDGWSSGDPSYRPKVAETTWKSVARMAPTGGRVTIGTLIYEAKRAGWRPNGAAETRLSDSEANRLAAEREARRAEQQRAHEEDLALAAAKANAVWDQAKPAPKDHAYLKRKGIEGDGLRHVAEWLVESVDDDSGEIRQLRVPNALLVPIWASPGRLVSLQAIFASKRNPLKRDKDFLKNGQTRGCYAVIGSIDADTANIIVCEGYATGWSLHAATGWPVIVGFYVANLLRLGKMVRARLPDALIVVAADNDQFLEPRADGTARNPGVEGATEAVKAIGKGAVLAVPQFSDLSAKPTDFNDLAALSGLAIVKAQIEVAINPPPPPAVAPPPGDDDAPLEDDASHEANTATGVPGTPDITAQLGHDASAHFRILGYDHDDYYFMSAESRQVIVRTKRDFTDVGLLELAPLDWWETEFPGKEAFNKKQAADWLIRACRMSGIYDNTRIRGRGAWIDAGRIVFHHGEKLSVDGSYTNFDRLRSRYVYEMDRALPEPHDTMLTADEGEWIIGLAEMFRWTMPGSAALLAGWCALAPVCGALRWRPHLWVTGGAGSGKSTIQNEFTHFLMGGVDIYAQGASSEAGIRQTLRNDALPVLFDESESTEESDARRIQSILSLIRQASTESHAKTLKGTAFGNAMSFHIRSMFCLASIQVAIKNQADIERLSVLNLRPPRDEADASGNWQRIKERLAMLRRDPTLPARLLRRSLNLLPVTLKSIDVFSQAFSELYGSVRDGDQYGTMLAGAWSLLSDNVATKEQAVELINRYDWSEHREDHDVDDSERALGYLLESRIRVNGGLEATVYELIRAAAGKPTDTKIGVVEADALLQRYGMRLSPNNTRLMLSNNSRSLRHLLSDTPFAADVRGMLLRVPGADKNGNVGARFNGSTDKCVTIPTDAILSDDKA